MHKELKDSLEKCKLNSFYYNDNNRIKNNMEIACDILDIIYDKIDSSLHRSEKPRRIQYYV